MKHKTYPEIKDTDIVYTYKEQAFTGYAPCFQNGLYSLACCKGAKNGNGMRQSVCRAVENGKNVWVLSIAAGNIKSSKSNFSGILYEPGEVIYLAKIDRALTWDEYSTSDVYSKRNDSYYVIRDGKVDWRKKIGNWHTDQCDLEHDCGIGCCTDNKTAEEIFKNDKQILIAREYYVFDKGQQLSGIDEYKPLDVGRGYKYIENGKVSRASILRNFIENNHAFYCTGGVDPFKKVSNKRTGGCR